jgi:Phosphomevalonate kinase
MAEFAYGKVLILGGYLVLYPKYSGIVVTCSAIFRCFIEILPTKESAVFVCSEKFFVSAKFLFPFEVIGNSNEFIDEAVKTSIFIISLFKNFKENDIKLTLVADDEFYKNGKTGLGSSAALINVIVKSLFRVYDLDNQELLYFTCLVSNFRAQNKIGSGFDVSATVYGSHIFRRNTSALVSRLIDNLCTTKEDVLSEISN